MAAGDLLTGDYQAELRGVLFGATTAYQTEPPGWAGLGTPPTKTADTTYDGRDGSRGAPDFLDVRVLTFPFVINEPDATNAMNALAVLNTAWAPTRDGVDLPLHVQLPGWGHVVFNGRPRGAVDNPQDVKSGVIRVLCRFDALDPTVYSP